MERDKLRLPVVSPGLELGLEPRFLFKVRCRTDWTNTKIKEPRQVNAYRGSLFQKARQRVLQLNHVHYVQEQ